LKDTNLLDAYGYTYVSLQAGAGTRYAFPSVEAAQRFALSNRTTKHPAYVFDSNGVVINRYLRKRVK
jgi:hypothetical protein